MKKKYVTPKVEMLDFDYTDTVVASGPALTDFGGVVSASGEVCQKRIVDIKSVDGTVCGYI